MKLKACPRVINNIPRCKYNIAINIAPMDIKVVAGSGVTATGLKFGKDIQSFIENNMSNLCKGITEDDICLFSSA